MAAPDQCRCRHTLSEDERDDLMCGQCGEEFCREEDCTETTTGDGWDGRCGDCADRHENEYPDFEEHYTVVNEDVDYDEAAAMVEMETWEGRHLWTIVEGDDGDLYAVAGWHYVNRIKYVTTQEAWNENAERATFRY